MIYIIIIFLFIIFYTYIGYPLLLIVLSKFFSNPVKINLTFQPKIVVIVPAYNEEKYIEDALVSILENGYPRDKLDVCLASDGSTDRTIEIAKKLQKKYFLFSS